MTVTKTFTAPSIPSIAIQIKKYPSHQEVTYLLKTMNKRSRTRQKASMYKLISQIPPVDLYLFKWFPHKNYNPDWLIPDLISALLYRWLTASNSFASAQKPLQLPCRWNPTQSTHCGPIFYSSYEQIMIVIFSRRFCHEVRGLTKENIDCCSSESYYYSLFRLFRFEQQL